ncbi:MULTISPECIES: F0F1 ATP synthase subunit A [unclassified Breznakia]|uniref:F0F1 ATP synthase subunit A n=1 Tax=unclassified Breznakia TaxID=2623764 RepID=UPI002474DB24|nr:MULTISPECIES: F0F1 ATP synthase subunit A [unclassified Breznakia]MDH6366530.1 F-type H+-transporting ATPase subunit a [Breznakia sp. PH1-1]MDH6403623.1 F-type H+-transporting ATPase subunit a [Breznakia sp. PF1-11]MDH6411332.1 F-type H+-transporting ATPase subunit a [Breznakia sp. PFB1-11]MDH6413692.1 F-type H+-transporting ATPase subunit a [Breznakia sp. PFB1-14]MDH6415877.1 F-type H+-transporting ATPase subunit a [Breznakia sp. PFB1-4]
MGDGILIKIGDFDLFVHQTIVIWIGVGILVCALLIWGGNKLKHADPTKPPKGAVLVFETIVNLCAMVVKGNLNKKTWKFLPYFGTIMIMMVISNLLGLFGLQPPTSNLSLAMVLAIGIFLLIHFSDIKNHGIKGKWKALTDPVPLLLPLNVIGDIAFPVSLTLRLFGNMLGGSIIMALVYVLVKAAMPFTGILLAVTPFLHMYFDMFTAFMQTYIFFTLATFFLSDAVDAAEE